MPINLLHNEESCGFDSIGPGGGATIYTYIYIYVCRQIYTYFLHIVYKCYFCIYVRYMPLLNDSIELAFLAQAGRASGVLLSGEFID